MSGHNKWSKIAGKKGIADAKRSAIFTRLAKAITVAAREGGGDVSMNFKLRMAIEQAKGANMPSDNIDRAIKRGTGEGGGAVMESGLYEAYGPGGVGIIVETLSDNKNRTVGEVQSAMKKSGATPAQQGSVL
ncbi:MAG: YebC/PmpR family DNA-binding transcriptional regulator, partial [Patescibacteria group bacterium]